MGKTILYTLVGLLVIALGVAIISCSLNPLRQSEEQIRGKMLELTPIGMHVDDVLEVFENNEEWGNYQHFDDGYLTVRDGRLEIRRHEFLQEDSKIIGVETIKVHLGTYLFGLGDTHVVAYWAFDENSNLIDIFVKKEWSGL